MPPELCDTPSVDDLMSCALQLNSHLIGETEFVTDVHRNQSICVHFYFGTRMLSAQCTDAICACWLLTETTNAHINSRALETQHMGPFPHMRQTIMHAQLAFAIHHGADH